MLLIGIGIVVAASPLMAAELGRKAHSVRDVRRTFRQSLWAATAICVPIWAILWQMGWLLEWAGQPPRLAADAGLFIRALMWQIWPALGVVAIRNFMAALEMPKWTMLAGFAAVIVNAVVNYGLIFGHFGLPKWGLVGAGVGSSVTSLFQFLFLAGVISFCIRVFAAIICLAAGGARTGLGSRRSGNWACPLVCIWDLRRWSLPPPYS